LAPKRLNVEKHIMNKRALSVLGACAVVTGWGVTSVHAGMAFTTIDYPGATQTTANGTDGTNIVGNASSMVSGVGFLYNTSTSAWTTINVPGSWTTNAYGISGGNIAGSYIAAGGVPYQGYVYNGSSYATLDDPSAVNGTQAYGIDGANVVGIYQDANHINHGFLYNGSAWTTLDDSLAVKGTDVEGISGSNIVGYYIDSTNIAHGFLYNGSSWTALNDPLGTMGTYCRGISGQDVVGYYVDNASLSHGFLYDTATSTWTSIDVPIGSNTLACGIGGGVIVGGYQWPPTSGQGLYTSVPEPTVAAGLLAGSLGLLLRRQQRHMRAA
jgi:hypothetical protein